MERLTELMSIPEMVEILISQKSEEHNVDSEIDEINNVFQTAFRNTLTNSLITANNRIRARYAKKTIRPEFYTKGIIDIPIHNAETNYKENKDIIKPSIALPPKTEIDGPDEIPNNIKKIIGDSKFLKKHYLLRNKVNRKVQYKKLYNEKETRTRRN